LRVVRDAGTASIDFSGTDPELYGNLNAPKAVVYSAIIYVMRCLVRHDIPLNQVRTAGLMAPLRCSCAMGSLLN
jgi:5-oxoprolinase (ATP-hydrolysing)